MQNGNISEHSRDIKEESLHRLRGIRRVSSKIQRPALYFGALPLDQAEILRIWLMEWDRTGAKSAHF